MKADFFFKRQSFKEEKGNTARQERNIGRKGISGVDEMETEFRSRTAEPLPKAVATALLQFDLWELKMLVVDCINSCF